MQTLAQMRGVLEERGLAPRKALGQNFLIDHNLIRKLVDVSGVQAGDVVLEVGPGTGTLTEELLERGCRVVACELDRGLAALLRDTLGERFSSTFRLIEGDCLDGKHALNAELMAALAGESRFVMVANLPYGAATPLMTVLLTDVPACAGMFVTVQREVADRLLGGPGERAKEYGPISVLGQALCEVKRVATLPPECFWPRPDVTSAMVGLVRRGEPRVPMGEARELIGFCRAVFAQRRKMIGSALGKGFEYPAGVSATSRAEQIAVDEMIGLFHAARAQGWKEAAHG